MQIFYFRQNLQIGECEYLKRGKAMDNVTQRILDCACGSQMFWFDKNNPDVIFMDNRELQDTLCDGRNLTVSPDVLGDFRAIPYPDNSFTLVVVAPRIY